MKKIMFGALCLIGFMSFAQSTVVTVSSGHGFRITPEEGKETVIGSMYISETFRPAKIAGDTEVLLLRYNAFRDEMEYQDKGELYYFIKSDNVEINFTADNKIYQYLNYTDEGVERQGYLLRLSEEGKAVGVFKKESIYFIPKKEITNGYDRTKPAEYKRSSDKYFIKTAQGIFNYPKNKKELIQLFPEHKTQITEFLKKNKISFSKEENLVALTVFLAAL